MQNNSKYIKADFENKLRQRILSGDLKPGDKLATERELALEYGISRGSVSQGILNLERSGFLRVAPRKGVYVADYIENATPMTMAAVMNYDSGRVPVAMFKDFMDMRILIERESVRLACARIVPQETEMLKDRFLKICDADKATLTDALYNYHRLLTVLSGNTAYSMIFQSFEKLIKKLIQTHFEDIPDMTPVINQYSELTDAITDKTENRADAAILDILGTASEYLNRKLGSAE